MLQQPWEIQQQRPWKIARLDASLIYLDDIKVSLCRSRLAWIKPPKPPSSIFRRLSVTDLLDLRHLLLRLGPFQLFHSNAERPIGLEKVRSAPPYVLLEIETYLQGRALAGSLRDLHILLQPILLSYQYHRSLAFCLARVFHDERKPGINDFCDDLRVQG